MGHRLAISGLLLALLLVIPGGCAFQTLDVGPPQQSLLSVPQGDAEDAVVKLSFGMGELSVVPGDVHVVQAHCTYNAGQLRPVLKQYEEGGQLHATLGMRDFSRGFAFWDWDEVKNEWSVVLGQELPTSLDFHFGAGEGDVDLGGVRLTALSVSVGAASLRIDWSAPNPEVIEHGRIDVGAAELRLLNLGNAGLRRLTIHAGPGSYTIDLSGAWTVPAEISIDASLAEVTVIVPEDLPVSIDRADVSLGELDLGPFERSSEGWRNPAARDRDPGVRLELSMSLGSLTMVEE